MRLTTVIKHLTKEYENARKNKLLRKEMSFALYQTWRWCDKIEKDKTECKQEQM